MHKVRCILLLIAIFFAACVPVTSQSLDKPQLSPSAHASLDGLRYGLSVTDLDGHIIEEHRSHERFMPASNAKLFVTAAALEAGAKVTALNSGVQVALEPSESGPPNLGLIGRGDPTMGYGADCKTRCLETLAKAVFDAGIREVGDVFGNDEWFADEPLPLGWSWDDLKFGHGTAISALSVNKNVVPLRISPKALAGTRLNASWALSGPSYFDLQNQAKTGDKDGEWALRLERRKNEKTARIYGELPIGSRAVKLDLGVDDPAHLAAWYFRQALEENGVRVVGKLRTQHRQLQYMDEPKPVEESKPEGEKACAPSPKKHNAERNIVATLPAAPLTDIVNVINKKSLNLYAEVLLRQLGRSNGAGSTFCGILEIERYLDGLGVRRSAYEIADGSGLSNYNRATPATFTTLLRHAAKAPWKEQFRASLPVGGGSTGTLKYRFRDSALEGNIFAKTGSLNHVDALSGYMVAQSGKTLVFSVIVNDRPLNTPSAAPHIDALLLDIAERN